jgi:hypothetical protein
VDDDYPLAQERIRMLGGEPIIEKWSLPIPEPPQSLKSIKAVILIAREKFLIIKRRQ